MTTKKEMGKELESKRKLIEYYRKEVSKLKIEIKELQDYKRGFVDAVYYLGGKK